MKRRKFLRTTAAAAAGAVFTPYLLPTGRLFASSGSQLAEHVVLVLFAGGVRQQESVLQQYLGQSQNMGPDYEGNILYNLLNGAPPVNKIVYGTDPQGQPAGSAPIPQLLSQTIESQGTFFPEVTFSKAGTGHYVGLSSVISGNYGVSQGLRQRPVFPTIFEYARRHLGLPATKTWMVGNGIGNSTPLLNCSSYENYGLEYGANFLAPTVTFSSDGENHLANAKVYHPDEQLAPIYEMKQFLDNTFQVQAGVIPGIRNTDDEKQMIKEFVEQMFDLQNAGQVNMPPVTDGGDAATIGWACEVIKYFKPNLLVVNMSSIDGCHSSFTGYLRAMHRCDHAVGHLWNFIQSADSGIANNTIMLVQPEHGRSFDPNPILDQNDWRAFDHNSDPNARRMFNLMVGPNVPAGEKVGSESNPVGDATDLAPTIAEILGFKSEIQSAGLLDVDALSLFDRI
jgi:hypothetical protein